MNQKILAWVIGCNRKSDQWCHCATFTAAMQFDEYLQISDITDDPVLTFTPGWPRPQNKEYLRVRAARNSLCLTFTVMRAEVSQRIRVISVCEPERALQWTCIHEPASVVTNGPSSMQIPGGFDKNLLWLWCSESLKMLMFCWLNAWSLKNHLTHPDESQVRSLYSRNDCFPCLFCLKWVQKY